MLKIIWSIYLYDSTIDIQWKYIPLDRGFLSTIKHFILNISFQYAMNGQEVDKTTKIYRFVLYCCINYFKIFRFPSFIYTVEENIEKE